MTSTIRRCAIAFCLSATSLALLPAGCGSNSGENAFETGASAKKQQLEELHQKAMEKAAAKKK